MKKLYYLIIFFILTSFNIKDIPNFQNLDIYYIDNSNMDEYQSLSSDMKGVIENEMMGLKRENGKFFFYISNGLTPLVCERFSDIETSYKPIYIQSYKGPSLVNDITQLKNKLFKTQFSVSKKVTFNCFVTDYFIISNFDKNMSSLIFKNLINQLEQMNSVDNCIYEFNFYYEDSKNKINIEKLETNLKFYQKSNTVIKIEKLKK